MSRKTERALLGVLAFVGAVVALVVGVQMLTGGSGAGSIDLAAGSGGDADAVDPESPVNSAGSGLGGARARSDSLVVGTTAGEDVSSSPTTVFESVRTSSVDGSDGSSSTAAAAPSSTSESAPTTVVATTSTSTDDGSDTSPTSNSGSSTSQTAVSFPTTIVRPGLTEIEREIVRLTNSLRANPSGPLRRVGPMPECVLESDDIELDPETGHPKPARKLTPSEPVSVRMSRDWSQRMADTDAMTHRSAESQDLIYSELGIDWAARGENVAWAVGYNLSDVAQLFFGGWRESDGHYCNMMSGSFTEIGVGHVRTAGGKDFATQNFYRPR